MDELDGQTMRDAMQKENKRIVAATLRQWEQSISGRLRTEHYRLLITATTQHLTLLDKALAQIEKAGGTASPYRGADWGPRFPDEAHLKGG